MKIRNPLLCIGFFFLALGRSLVTASEFTPAESWVISKTIESSLEDIEGQELVDSLKDFGISAKITSLKDALENYVLLKGKWFTVYLAPVFLEENQVWIMANPDLKASFETLNAEQLGEMEKFRYLIGEAYQKALGYQGYVMFADLKKEYGLERPTFCLEMIPASLKGPHKDLVDLHDKVGRTSYVLFATPLSHHLTVKDAKAKVKRIKSALAGLKNKGRTLENQKRKDQNTLPWVRTLTNVDVLQQDVIQALQQELFAHHALLMSHTRADVAKKQQQRAHRGTISSPIKKCAFCDPKVINNQLVCKKGDFSVLYHFKPYTEGAHFMITPSSPLHVEDWQNFSFEDVLQIDSLAQTIVQELKKESGREDVIFFMQNGLAAGMTVPHGHLHVLLRPSKRHFISQVLLEISNHKRKGLTPQEMAPLKKKFKERLEKS